MMDRLKGSIKVLLGKSKAIPIMKKIDEPKFYCPNCRQKVSHFYPLPFHYYRELDRYGFIHPFFLNETFNFESYSCSQCGASDRERLYALYFETYFSGRANVPVKLLDIAPARALSKYLQTIKNIQIRTADLLMEGVDDIVDITNMGIYPDESFDIFICSHVLEHIENDLDALRELYRVLARDGWGIAMVPINLGLMETYENPAITDTAGRWKHFGQGDHVRMYSKEGFINRLTSVGFKVEQYDIQSFGADVFQKNGIHPRSVLYIVRK